MGQNLSMQMLYKKNSNTETASVKNGSQWHLDETTEMKSDKKLIIYLFIGLP